MHLNAASPIFTHKWLSILNPHAYLGAGTISVMMLDDLFFSLSEIYLLEGGRTGDAGAWSVGKALISLTSTRCPQAGIMKEKGNRGVESEQQGYPLSL